MHPRALVGRILKVVQVDSAGKTLGRLPLTAPDWDHNIRGINARKNPETRSIHRA